MHPPKSPPPVLFGILREKPVGIGIAKKFSEMVLTVRAIWIISTNRHPTTKTKKLLTV
jgi:hypothetical protein